jgi:hypothetical protein
MNGPNIIVVLFSRNTFFCRPEVLGVDIVANNAAGGLTQGVKFLHNVFEMCDAGGLRMRSPDPSASKETSLPIRPTTPRQTSS